MLTLAQRLGLALFLVAFALFFVRQRRSGWMNAFEALFLFGGLILIAPPGLLQFPPFRSALRDLIVLLIIAGVGCLVSRIAGRRLSDDEKGSGQSADARVDRAARLLHSIVGGDVAGVTEDWCNFRTTCSGNERPVIVTLVHGTFQPEAAWVSKDSQFSQALRRGRPMPRQGGNISLVWTQLT